MVTYKIKCDVCRKTTTTWTGSTVEEKQKRNKERGVRVRLGFKP